MTSGIYIDTSLLAAYYAPEPLSSTVQRRMESASSVAIGWLVRPEMASAMAKKRRRGELSAVQATRLLDRFDEHVGSGLYRLLPIRSDDHDRAYSWIRREALNLPTLDALHLAVASRESLHVMTADRGMAEAASALELACELVTPRD